MSQENVEIVRRMLEAFIRGDDDFGERFDADIEWTTAADEPDPQGDVAGDVAAVQCIFDRGKAVTSRSEETARWGLTDLESTDPAVIAQ